VRQFCVNCLAKRPFNDFFNVFGASVDLICRNGLRLYLITLKAHRAVRCVVSFVSRSLYTWTALHLFFNSFCRVGLLIRYLHDRSICYCFVMRYLNFFFNVNVCGFFRLDTPLREFSIEVISGGAFHCCIINASLFVTWLISLMTEYLNVISHGDSENKMHFFFHKANISKK